MRDCPHQQLRRVARQDCVRIQRDDVANESQPACVSDDRAECFRRSTSKELVELSELSALSLPAHPHALLGIPKPRPVKQKKHVFAGKSIPRVQRFDSNHSGREDLLVAGPVFREGIGEVAEDRELQVGITIGEILDFEVLERFLHSVHACE